MKKKRIIQTLIIDRKKQKLEYSSENVSWLIKPEGVYIYSPTKVKAINMLFVPMHTIDQVHFSKETINLNNPLQKYLEQNLK